MEKLNFYTADLEYVASLKEAELNKRGFSRVPDFDYPPPHKPNFLCGVVLQINGLDYYVPVTSFKKSMPDNFVIRADNGNIVGSLRFNYMFPIPKELVTERRIDTEQDRAYRALLAQERQYCIKNQDTIRKLAKRTYKKVLLGQNQRLAFNSCDFLLLEEICRSYIKNRKPSLQERINGAKARTPSASSPASKPKSLDGR